MMVSCGCPWGWKISPSLAPISSAAWRRFRPLAAAESARLDAIAARGHRAPVARSVFRVVVKSPLARFVAAKPQPVPAVIEHGARGDRKQFAQCLVYAACNGSERRLPVGTELHHQLSATRSAAQRLDRGCIRLVP